MKQKVLVAMSGGVDSSLSALLLQEEGFEVYGATLQTWDYYSSSCQKETGCCSLDSLVDARNVAEKLKIHHVFIDVRNKFEEIVIRDFIDAYLSGKTPNPCVLCNARIKWDILLNKADELGCTYLATGHYACIKKDQNRFFLAKGVDENKDQSYFLWGLQQHHLKRTLLPLGGYRKNEIKKIADKKGFKNLADKKESVEICFIPDNNYRGFLIEKKPDLKTLSGTGNFISTDGKILGKHKGFPFYTIGQRKGLEIAVGYPLYVVEIRAESNTIVLGNPEDLLKSELYVHPYNLIKYTQISGEMKVVTRIRYHNQGTSSVIRMEGDKIRVVFDKPVSAVTPGQSAVFYEGDDMIGGGIIL